VAVVSQSGGLAGDIVRTGYERGLRYSAVVSLGNAADLGPAELVAHFMADPSTEAVGLYVEGPDDRLAQALRAGRGVVPAVLLVGGTSAQGAVAASSHTGALAGDARLWEALSRATGATVVGTLEDFLGVLRFHQVYGRRDPGAAGPETGVLVVGAGGGASVLGTDACERAGLRVAPTHDALRAHLRGLGYGVGMSVANPMEVAGGPLAPPDVFHRLVDLVVEAQPYSDLLLHLNVQSYLSFGGDGIAVLAKTLGLLSPDRWPGTRVAVALRNQEAARPEDLGAVLEAALACGVPAYRTFDEAAVALAAGQRFAAAVAAG
jgi:acyl-CoA synthetase (NDP forming)